MSNCLIIEDEKYAADQLKRLLLEYDSTMNISGPLASISEAVDILKKHSFDFILCDIQLNDGPSFEIFNQLDIDIPIIFCTAYDQYALKAFKLNSIDYLLKPIEPTELFDALDKLKKQKSTSFDKSILENILSLKQEKTSYKKRFVIKIAEQLKICETNEVALIYSQDKANFIFTTEGRSLAIDQSLDQLETELNPEHFFRISRQFIIHLNAIKTVHQYSGSRLKIDLKLEFQEETIVSRARSSEFKHWLNQ